MEAKDRIIVALDVDSLEKAKVLVEQLALDVVGCFKVGLELLTSEGAPKVVNAIHEWGGQVFYDGKFNDIPNTVAGAAKAVRRMGVKMFNIHCLSGSEAMQKTREAVDTAFNTDETITVDQKILHTNSLILGVTILTSLDFDNLRGMGFFQETADIYPNKDHFMKELVVQLAQMAKGNGLDGVISSPKEIETIREKCGQDFKIVTPGIRPTWSVKDDQKRFTTPAEAIKAGADYLVIGRPITNPPAKIGSPVEAVKRIIAEIEEVKL